jgi:hypothetical protein
LTAGFAAKSTSFYRSSDWREYRGISFSIGGDKKAVTLPNFMRHYRNKMFDNVQGASIGSNMLKRCNGGQVCPQEWKYDPKIENLNAALSGGTSEDLDKEATYLIETVKNRESIDIDKDWKVGSIVAYTLTYSFIWIYKHTFFVTRS